MTPINETPNRLDALRGTAEMAVTSPPNPMAVTSPPNPMAGTSPPSPIGNTPPMSPEMLSEVTSDPMMGEDPMEIAANMPPEELTSGVVSTVLTASNSPEEALAIIESAADEIRALVQQGSGQDAGRLEELLGGLPV